MLASDTEKRGERLQYVYTKSSIKHHSNVRECILGIIMSRTPLASQVHRKPQPTIHAPIVWLNVLDRLSVVLEDVDPHDRAIKRRVRALDHLVIEMVA